MEPTQTPAARRYVLETLTCSLTGIPVEQMIPLKEDGSYDMPETFYAPVTAVGLAILLAHPELEWVKVGRVVTEHATGETHIAHIAVSNENEDTLPEGFPRIEHGCRIYSDTVAMSTSSSDDDVFKQHTIDGRVGRVDYAGSTERPLTRADLGRVPDSVRAALAPALDPDAEADTNAG